MFPSLKRFEVTVLKDKSAWDKAQVPTAATISVHPQGPVLLTSFDFPEILEDSQPIEVRLLGGGFRRGTTLSWGMTVLARHQRT